MSAPSRGVAMTGILVATFANYLTFTVLTVALGPIASELHASLDDVAWVTLAPALVSGLLTPGFGSLGDRIGRRSIFLLGLTAFTLGTVGSAFAPSLAWLVAARVLTGIGSAASMPTGIALATDLYEPAERTVPMSRWTTVTALAPALGVLGGPIIEWWSWRALFAVQLPFALLALGVAARYVPESKGEPGGRFDYAGATLLGAAFFLLTLAANRANDWGLRSSAIVGSTLVAGALLVAVVYVERRVSRPVVPMQTLRDPVVRLALAGRSLMYAVHMGSFLLLPSYLREVHALGPAAVSLVLLPRPVAMGVAAPLSATLSRRLPASVVMLLGVSSMLVGVFALVAVDPDDSTLALLPSLLAMGAGLGVTQTVTAAEITGRTAASDLGASGAMLAIATALAGSLGSATLLAFATRPGVSREIAYHDAFLASAALSVMTLVLAIRQHVLSRRV